MQSHFQMEYQINGVPSVFEFYLFINPLGEYCMKSELQLFKSTQRISAYKDLHILPFNNSLLIEQYLKQIHTNESSVNIRNEIFHKIYEASLAFKAASMQGKRFGRDFLIILQQEISGDIQKFNHNLIYQTGEQVGLEMDVFKHDFNSKLVRKLYFNDQKTAQEMQVKETPTLIIIEHQSGIESIISREFINEKNILKEINLIVSDYLNNVHKTPRHYLSLIKK